MICRDHMYSSDDVVNISYVKNACSNKHDPMHMDGLSNFFEYQYMTCLTLVHSEKFIY